MTSRRWGRLVSALVFSLTLATAGSARAQFGFPGISGQPSIGPFTPGYGTGIAYGIYPSDYGLVGCAGCGGPSVINPAIWPVYGPVAVPTARTTTSYQAVYSAVSVVPGWDAPSRRVRRRR